MRVLRQGSTGPDVEAWEHFLSGLRHYPGEIDGNFDLQLKSAVTAFQATKGLVGDGIIGPKTWAAAMADGLDPTVDDSTGEDTANWPPPPSFGPLSAVEREKLFGKFAFVPAPSADPEAIRITDGWYGRNMVNVSIPQLARVQYAPKSCRIEFHEKAADQLVRLFQAWDDAGLMDRVKTWGGAYVARFVRGSRTSLSNHSFGSAFDINVPWNMLGTQPALKGKMGSVRELVGIANNHGFFWGGHFKTVSPTTGKPRLDGMHFEVAKIV